MDPDLMLNADVFWDVQQVYIKTFKDFSEELGVYSLNVKDVFLDQFKT